MTVFKEFQGKGSFEKSIHAIFIALIPKKADAVDIKDVCPINLVGVVYKIICKVLINILKQGLEKIISNLQNTLLRGDRVLERGGRNSKHG